jgi:alanine racemase
MRHSADRTRAWVDVDLDALLANAGTIHARSGARLLPMVKANGYGLGAIAVARALGGMNPWGFGVATVDEARALLEAGVDRPLVVFTPLTPETLDAAVALGARPAIGDVTMLRAWIARSDAPFHLEIDTGMSRSGIRADDGPALTAAAAAVAVAPGWEGVFTHFQSSECDPAATETQWRAFESALRAFPRRPPLVHAANSAAALADRRYAGDLVRPGIFLYGGAAGEAARPVARLRARVVAVRRVAAGEPVSYNATWRAERATTVATLGIGYADGVPRSLSNRGQVELGGRVRPVVGRVTMDMTMVAVDDGEVVVGDVATLFGGAVSLDQQAALAGTISYELLTNIGARVPRIYAGGTDGSST